MNQHKRNERGIAMVVAIVAIVVIGAMVIGVASAVVFEHRQAQMSGQIGQAFAVTELGLNDAIADWDAAAASALAVNDSFAFAGAAPGGAGSYTGWIRRLGAQLYLVEVTGTSEHDGARERLGAFVKSGAVAISVRAAARGGGGGGQASLKNDATLSGLDMVPVGWGPRCAGPLEDIPGAEWNGPYTDSAKDQKERKGHLDGWKFFGSRLRDAAPSK